MGTFAWNHEAYARASSREAVLDMVKELATTVPEITRICAEEGIDADIVPSEELMIATNPAQLVRMREELAHHHHWGDAHRARELTPQEVAQRISIPNVLGLSLIHI